MTDSKDPKKVPLQEVGEHCFLNSDPIQRLSSFERLTLTGGNELDRAMGWASRGLRNLEHMLSDVQFSFVEYRAALDYYSKEHPFFQEPKATSINEVQVHAFPDGEVVDLSFDSSFKLPAHQDVQRFCQDWSNAQVYARCWRHHGEPRTLVLAIHGWTMGDQRLNSLAFLPGEFYRRGFDVMLVELPFHGRRRAEKFELATPGAQFFGTNEAIFQSISDLRQLISHVRATGYSRIGWIGVSLGSYLGALLSTLIEFTFNIALVPLVSIEELAWHCLSKQENFKSWQKLGLKRKDLDVIYGVHSPLTLPFKAAAKSSIIVAGLNDLIVPARQVKMLWEHWRRPDLRWLQGGHGAQFYKAENYKSQMMQEVFGFVDSFLK